MSTGFHLLNAIYRVVFVSSLALIVDIKLHKERLVCFLFVFVGELILYIECLFNEVSWLASLKKFCFEVVHVLIKLCFRGVCS